MKKGDFIEKIAKEKRKKEKHNTYNGNYK